MATGGSYLDQVATDARQVSRYHENNHSYK